MHKQTDVRLVFPKPSDRKGGPNVTEKLDLTVYSGQLYSVGQLVAQNISTITEKGESLRIIMFPIAWTTRT